MADASARQSQVMMKLLSGNTEKLLETGLRLLHRPSLLSGRMETVLKNFKTVFIFAAAAGCAGKRGGLPSE